MAVRGGAKARRADRQDGRDGEVLFETGYGPSGLPHIGTFGEVARTSMVRHAFEVLTEGKVKTRLLAFSDDMDGLRKVPDNVPNRAMLPEHLGKPLTRIPDPFGKFESFAHHNNAMLRAFLDRFGFDYEFASSTQYYTSGRFDAALLHMLGRFEQVQAHHAAVAAPGTSLDLFAVPADLPRTGVVMQVPLLAIDAKAGTISCADPDTKKAFETPVTGGQCKLQWKPDWAMRWYALNVDYEMAGKDLIDSVKLSGEIVEASGAPAGRLQLRTFPRRKGGKISKSKGNGLTIDEWLTYASPESLSLFMFQKPREAKRLYFDVIPRPVDEYSSSSDGYGAAGRASSACPIRSGISIPATPPHGRHADLVLHAADAGVIVERGERRDAVRFHRPLPAGRDGQDPPQAQRGGRVRHPLFPRLRAAAKEISRAGRGRAQGAARSP